MTIHYKKFISLADIVMTNCDNVKKVFHRYNGDIIVIPNGCDLEEPPRLSKNNKIINLQKLMKPVIGYVGNIEKQRFDFNLIQYIAQSHPDWQIVLIGSVHNNNNIIIQQLKQMSNITFLGVIPYPEVKAWIKLFDVAIIPHKDTIQTRLMNPLKLYVYCSLGVPVVTTNIANIDAFKDIIMVANNHKQFVSKIERLLDDNKCYNFSKISDCIIEHSWVNRVQLIIDHITQKLVEIPFF
jgi:glycosyltransferase involved in cell wall biosynthesis